MNWQTPLLVEHPYIQDKAYKWFQHAPKQVWSEADELFKTQTVNQVIVNLWLNKECQYGDIIQLENQGYLLGKLKGYNVTMPFSPKDEKWFIEQFGYGVITYQRIEELVNTGKLAIWSIDNLMFLSVLEGVLYD